MTIEIIVQVILFGIALAMDAFAVSITEGLTIVDLNKKRILFIALVYGVFQALFPLAGFFAVEGVTVLVGAAAGVKAGEIMSTLVTWISFALLLYIGLKMLIEAIMDMKKEEESKDAATFSVKEILIMGVATAIDALATGVAFHNQDANGVAMSTNATIWLHASIIMICTFIISLLGLLCGKFFEKLLNGKYEITGIIGGIILIALGIWVVLEHYL